MKAWPHAPSKTSNTTPAFWTRWARDLIPRSSCTWGVSTQARRTRSGVLRPDFSRSIPPCRRRVALENDERLYTISDALTEGLRLNAPVVFDNLHHANQPGGSCFAAILGGGLPGNLEGIGRPAEDSFILSRIL